MGNSDQINTYEEYLNSLICVKPSETNKKVHSEILLSKK